MKNQLRKSEVIIATNNLPRDPVTTVVTLCATEISLAESVSASKFLVAKRDVKSEKIVSFRYQRLSTTKISVTDNTFNE